jgi:hypothetical protein
MTLAAAQLLVNVLAGYAAAGAVFGVLFLWKWVGRLDGAAAHVTWVFRVLVFPGVVLFWPLFMARLLGGASEPPDEWTAHRAAARRGSTRGRIEILR